jgi:hypothetical protein
MECKNVIRPIGAYKNAVGRAVLSLDNPTNAKQGGKDVWSFG